MRHRFRFPVLLALAASAGCQGNPFGVGGSGFSVSFSSLLPIAQKYGHYAVWGKGTGGSTLIGRFLVGPAGAITDLEGKAKTTWAATSAGAFSEIVVTQEVSADTTSPSKQIFLEGTLSGGSATLLAPVKAVDYAGAAGTFVLDNPAFLPKQPNVWNGIWFEALDRDADGKITSRRPGLDMPVAPQGWAYAGWVILQPSGIPLRCGKFRDPADNDDWAGYTGLNSVSLPVNFPGPPMPGEDFNTNLPAGVLPEGASPSPAAAATNLPDLANSQVIVSVENAALANEDQYPGPIHVFEGTVPASTSQNLQITLSNVAARSIPSGKATFQ